MTYKYQQPEGRMYKVPIRKWNKEFARRGRPLFVTAYIYLNKKEATVEFKANLFGRTVFALLLPLLYLYGTVMTGFPETHDELVRTLRQEKYGTFSSEVVRINDPKGAWGRMLQLIKVNL